jgi:tRNA (cmo5U34)-methyltransferase
MSSEPQWQEQDSQLFINYGTLFVPQREAIFAATGALLPARSGGTILELACGAGELAAHLLAAHADVDYTALDMSPAMLAAAAERLQPFAPRVQLQQADLAASDWRQFSQLRAIVSSLAVHHLDDAAKQQLFRDCRRMLADDGVFVLFDVVRHRRDEVRLVAAADWDSEVAERSRRIVGDDGPLQFFRSEDWNMYASAEIDPVDKPSTVRQLLNWLSDAGFSEVDLVRQYAGHALIAAYG